MDCINVACIFSCLLVTNFAPQDTGLWFILIFYVAVYVCIDCQSWKLIHKCFFNRLCRTAPRAFSKWKILLIQQWNFVWLTSLNCFRGTSFDHEWYSLPFFSFKTDFLISLRVLFCCFSDNAMSIHNPNWEDLLSFLFVIAKTLVKHFEPKVGYFLCFRDLCLCILISCYLYF